MEVTIDALDLTVLRGGADEVGRWATEHGFRLPPDAPEVLEFYAARSQIFLAAAFDPTAAAERGQQVGDGTAVHITIPTDDPWVPLRILALGKTGTEPVEADVYLLTEASPTLLPAPDGFNGMTLDHSAEASPELLADLRSDRGMAWVPESAWLTKVAIDADASQLGFDLAIDATGAGVPSRVDAGLDMPGAVDPTVAATIRWVVGLSFIVARRRRHPGADHPPAGRRRPSTGMTGPGPTVGPASAVPEAGPAGHEAVSATRPGWLVWSGTLALVVGLAGIAFAWTSGVHAGDDGRPIEIGMRYSAFTPAVVTVPAGRPGDVRADQRRPHRPRVAGRRRGLPRAPSPGHRCPSRLAAGRGLRAGRDDRDDHRHVPLARGVPLHLPPARPRGLRHGRCRAGRRLVVLIRGSSPVRDVRLGGQGDPGDRQDEPSDALDVLFGTPGGTLWA